MMESLPECCAQAVIDSITQLASQHAELIITLVKIGLLLFIVLTVNAYLTLV